MLTAAGRAKAYGRHETIEELADCLDSYFDMLERYLFFLPRLTVVSSGEDEISDDASSTLKQIRRQISAMNDRVHSTLTGMVNGPLRTYLQDAIITMRGDRYCIQL